MRTPVPSGVRLSGDASQRTFDVLMRALSEPGSIRALPTGVLDPTIPPIAWLALALADVDVPVAANPAAMANSTHPLDRVIAEGTGAPIVELDEAWVALLDQPSVDEFDQTPFGSALEPEAGARLAIAVEDLSGSPRAAQTIVELRGPGVPGVRQLAIKGLSRAIVQRLGRRSDFPAGRDVWLFTRDGFLAAIPRSTTVAIVGEEH